MITAIYHPSSRSYHMSNKVIFPSEGNPIYYGHASEGVSYFSSIGFMPSSAMNPVNFMLDLANDELLKIVDREDNYNNQMF